MKQHVVFWGLVLFTIESLVDWLLTTDLWSLIVAIGLGCLADLARAGIKPEAPHAEKEENPFGSSDHQAVYIRTLDHCVKQIQMNRELWREWRDVPNSEFGDRYWLTYDHWKDNYWLVFRRYQKAKEKYGWRN